MRAAAAGPDVPILAELLSAVRGARLVRGHPGVPITGVAYDTRRLRPGELFVAIPGLRSNGLDFVSEAVTRGASAVVAQAEPRTAGDVPLVLVRSARAALADMATAFYGHPSRRLAVVGVTGTDGKTSTVQLLSAILEARGLRTGWLSTVSTKVGTQVRPNASEHTTPEAPVVQRTLAEMVAAGVDVAIVETSSHALALDRVRGVDFDVAVFTNLSPDHLNFHRSFEAYRAAKARLLAGLAADGLAVLNADDPSSAFYRTVTRAPVRTYALEADADLRATAVRVSAEGTTFTLREGRGRRRGSVSGSRNGRAVAQLAQWGAVPEGTPVPAGGLVLRSRLIGRFNAANWLAAYCAATYFGATPEDLSRAVERQDPVPGRMNLVHQGQPFLVVVDFAHTPQALESALDAVRPLATGRILALFGMPGGRDARNRSVMGWIAAKRCNFFAISTDDPFDEDPAEIAAEIARGADLAGAVRGERYVVELDRRVALSLLLRRAGPGDVVLLAGHGHLDHLVVGAQKLPWNDAEVAAEELRALGYHGQ